jgi:multidrug efflux system membrane fusion protein
MIGCSKKQDQPKVKPAVPISAAQAEQRDIPLQLKAIGNVEPFTSVSIKPLVGGTIASVHFKEGQDVRRGQLLFTIDPRPFQAALRQAEAILLKDQAQARNSYEQARRYAGLVKDGIVTQEQYDQLKTAADAFSATVAADRAAVENAKLQLAYCYIKSPLEGKTGNLVVNAGNVVKANETALVNINQITPIYASFTLPERELSGIKQHLTAGDLKLQAIIPNDGQQPENGVITFLDNNVDLATGTIRLKGTFVNRQRRLWPGQFVNLIITLATRLNSTVVPTVAVQTGQQGQYLFVVNTDNTVELRPVVAGISHEGVTVVEKGIKPGEMVVTDGHMRLAPGSKVELRTSDKAGNGSTPTATAAPVAPAVAKPVTSTASVQK